MSRIIIYNTKLSPELNAKVDNIQTYLNSLSATLDRDVQYQKIELDMNVKVDIPQNYQTTKIGNYVDLIQDEKHFYFFIIDSSWTSKGAVNLTLSLDTVNTFSGDFTFTEKTHIIREHKNRFSNLSSLEVGDNSMHYVVDDTDEGVSGAVQYKQSDETIFSGNNYLNQPWYIIYDTDITSGVNVEVLPKNKVPVMGSTEQYAQIRFVDQNINAYNYVLRSENLDASIAFNDGENNITKSMGEKHYTQGGYGFIEGFIWRRLITNQWEIGFYLKADNGNEFLDIKTYNFSDVSQIMFINATKYRTGGNRWETLINEILRKTTQNTFTPYVPTEPAVWTREINDVDRTSQTIIKIVECPYCPLDLTWENGINLRVPEHWVYDGNKGKITCSEQRKLPEFKSGVITELDLDLVKNFVINNETELANLPKIGKGLIADPKLMHSSLYTYKLVYDNFALPIALEKIKERSWFDADPLLLSVEYKQSENISSSLLFKANFKNCTYTEDSDYGSYLISTRSLESPVYNEAYLNYLRNGYNYDKKAKNTQNVATWFGAGVQLVGGVLSFLASGATGGISAVAGVSLVSSGIATMANATANTINSERNLAQKLEDARNQAATVNACDDLSLLNYYNGNKLHCIKYQVSDKIRKLMSDTFYYFGYASERYAIPRTNTRIWFNYIQCEPVFNEEQTTVYKDFLKDIKTRYSAGITVFHNYNGEYNFEQTYENWESVLF